MTVVDRGELRGPVLDVAPRLLGAVFRHGPVALRLTEVEAYDGANDPGSHAFRGQTPRTRVMFGPPGHLYVYFTYGMHHCVNVVCGDDGRAAAVLLRAGEIIEGADLVAARQPNLRPRDWARGPARMTRALGIDRTFDGVDLCDPDGPVTLEWGLPSDSGAERPVSVLQGPRVGVAGEGGDATRFPWRFWLEGDPTVSVYRPALARRRTPRPTLDTG